jgi:hypothetical protein
MSEPPPLLYGGPRHAISRRFAGLQVEDLRALEAAVLELAREREYRKKVDHGFWYAWYDGPRLGRDEEREVSDLFTEVAVAIATGLTGLDVARYGARLRPASEGPLERLTAFFTGRPSHPLQDAAVALMDDACAPWDPRLGFIAAWNAACAIAFRGRIPERSERILVAAWLKVFDELPA